MFAFIEAVDKIGDKIRIVGLSHVADIGEIYFAILFSPRRQLLCWLYVLDPAGENDLWDLARPFPLYELRL